MHIKRTGRQTHKQTPSHLRSLSLPISFSFYSTFFLPLSPYHSHSDHSLSFLLHSHQLPLPLLPTLTPIPTPTPPPSHSHSLPSPLPLPLFPTPSRPHSLPLPLPPAPTPSPPSPKRKMHPHVYHWVTCRGKASTDTAPSSPECHGCQCQPTHGQKYSLKSHLPQFFCGTSSYRTQEDPPRSTNFVNRKLSVNARTAHALPPSVS